jgi:hypothetical protein
LISYRGFREKQGDGRRGSSLTLLWTAPGNQAIPRRVGFAPLSPKASVGALFAGALCRARAKTSTKLAASRTRLRVDLRSVDKHWLARSTD